MCHGGKCGTIHTVAVENERYNRHVTRHGVEETQRADPAPKPLLFVQDPGSRNCLDDIPAGKSQRTRLVGECPTLGENERTLYETQSTYPATSWWGGKASPQVEARRIYIDFGSPILCHIRRPVQETPRKGSEEEEMKRSIKCRHAAMGLGKIGSHDCRT